MDMGGVPQELLELLAQINELSGVALEVAGAASQGGEAPPAQLEGAPPLG